MGVASHSDADMVLRVKDADLQDDTDATLSWNSENSSGSSTPRTPRSKNASTFKNGGGRVSQVIGTTSPALLFSIIVCVSVLSVLSVLAYTNITPASLQELHETVTAKKLLWWDAWYHGRVTEEQIKSLPKQCLDYRLSVYHSVTNRIVADDTEKSYAPVNLSTSEAYPNKGRIPATSELSMDDAIPKNIYFLHFNPVFTMYRYVCSIESAARLNPNHIITVFAKNVTDLDRTLDKWRAVVGDQMGSRVKVKRIDYTTYFQETPLEPWWKEGRWRQSHWVGQNLGNALRLAIVYKEGGVYLDMDIISLNPLDNIGRSIAREEQDRINNAAISFPRRDPLVWALMEEFLDGWNGWLWANNGPYSVTRMFQKRCQKTCLGIGLIPKANPNDPPPRPKPKPVEAKPDGTKPTESKPDEVKPDESKPAQSKPDQSKSDESKPDESKPDTTKPDESKPEETKPDESQPDESTLDESKPAQSKPDESKPDESKPNESKPDESKPDETKPDESQPDESTPDESKPDESKPDESKPDESKPDATKPDETKPDESQPDETKPDERKPDETKPQALQTDESKADESKADEAKADESKADGSKPDESRPVTETTTGNIPPQTNPTAPTTPATDQARVHGTSEHSHIPAQDVGSAALIPILQNSPSNKDNQKSQDNPTDQASEDSSSQITGATTGKSDSQNQSGTKGETNENPDATTDQSKAGEKQDNPPQDGESQKEKAAANSPNEMEQQGLSLPVKEGAAPATSQTSSSSSEVSSQSAEARESSSDATSSQDASVSASDEPEGKGATEKIDTADQHKAEEKKVARGHPLETHLDGFQKLTRKNDNVRRRRRAFTVSHIERREEGEERPRFGLLHSDYDDPDLLKDESFCENVHVFQPSRFYPIHYSNRAALIDSWEKQCPRLHDLKQKSIGLHWWNKIVGNESKLSKDSLLAVIMQTQAPGVIEAYGLDALQIE